MWSYYYCCCRTTVQVDATNYSVIFSRFKSVRASNKGGRCVSPPSTAVYYNKQQSRCDTWPCLALPSSDACRHAPCRVSHLWYIPPKPIAERTHRLGRRFNDMYESCVLNQDSSSKLWSLVAVSWPILLRIIVHTAVSVFSLCIATDTTRRLHSGQAYSKACTHQDPSPTSSSIGFPLCVCADSSCTWMQQYQNSRCLLFCRLPKACTKYFVCSCCAVIQLHKEGFTHQTSCEHYHSAQAIHWERRLFGFDFLLPSVSGLRSPGIMPPRSPALAARCHFMGHRDVVCAWEKPLKQYEVHTFRT